jgi:hypothetical protein
VSHSADSKESAESMLAALAKEPAAVKPGPVRLGDAGMITSSEGLALIAANYQAAFNIGIKCYPYFTDR